MRSVVFSLTVMKSLKSGVRFTFQNIAVCANRTASAQCHERLRYQATQVSETFLLSAVGKGLKQKGALEKSLW